MSYPVQLSRLTAASTIFIGMGLVSLTPGCANQPYSSPQQQAQNACQAFGPKTLSGMAVGGLVGGVGGAGIGAAAGGGKGALIGGLVGLGAGLLAGSAIGHSYDVRDCQQAQLALVQLRYSPVGQPIQWSNPTTGSYGSYTATSAEYQQNGQFCRQARQTATFKGSTAQPQQVLTCRQPDGNYKSVLAS